MSFASALPSSMSSRDAAKLEALIGNIESSVSVPALFLFLVCLARGPLTHLMHCDGILSGSWPSALLSSTSMWPSWAVLPLHQAHRLH